ncbi:hypothetical protein ACFQMH_25115 [Streptomyces viridiviolaceus]|uniref:Uncharacterized protein n=1 Tax=Streptomyces viridiviolaceus TaxID=68282 RepID=A0ABW2E476_9ACTN|nr:hypothetical protein [Streptomyces viridiviolaceus]
MSVFNGVAAALRRFRVAYPVIMVVGGAVLVIVCRARGIDPTGALVMLAGSALTR